MKKNILLFLAAVLAVCSFPLYSSAAVSESILSEAAILMDAQTGQVLFNKNMDKMMFPASTTKIMTALLAAENCDMDEIATVTKSALEIDEWNSSNIALSPDEELPVDSLMYALMLPSANDAANVLAEHVAGSQRDFARMMTARARSMGALDTSFSNAHGLHEPTHYTTAYDLAVITREASKNPVFMKYFGTGTHAIPPTNLQPLERPFTNYQYMLVNTTQFYDSTVTGGKVGYTREAEHTMSTIAEKDGRTLICVVLKSPYRYDKFKDTRKLLDFGFNEFTEVNISKEKFPGYSAQIMDGGNEAGSAYFRSTEDFSVLLHNSLDPSRIKIDYSNSRPFKADENIEAFAEFSIAQDDPDIPELLGRVKLEADVEMFAPNGDDALNFKGDLSVALLDERWIKPLIVLVAVIMISVTFFAVCKIRAHRRRKRRRQRLARLRREETASFYAGTGSYMARK